MVANIGRAALGGRAKCWTLLYREVPLETAMVDTVMMCSLGSFRPMRRSRPARSRGAGRPAQINFTTAQRVARTTDYRGSSRRPIGRAAEGRGSPPTAPRRAKLFRVNHDQRRTDFFISYTGVDQEWAEWIAFVLEDRGFTAIIQAWDFHPGGNFILEMQEAAEHAAQTIVVLSADYLQSSFARPEWAAALVQDPLGRGRKLLPVKIKPCAPEGMLKPIVHIDLIGLNEAAARERLLAGVAPGRAKPANTPAFPGSGPAAAHPTFPGQAAMPPPQGLASYVPDLRGPPSDLEKRRFMKEAFETIAAYFEGALPAVAAADRHIDVDYQREGPSECTAEIFRAGASVAFCRVWRGTELGGDGIAYAEGRAMSRGSHNEMLSIATDQGELRLQALMSGFAFGRMPAGLDDKRLTPEQAAEYLWHRFVGRLER